MKKKEIATALGLSVALSMTATGCASQDEVNSLNAQVSELQAQVTELQSEVDTEQAKSDNVEKQNESLTAQIEELQSEIESLNEELTVDGEMIADADEFADNASINVTKYSQKDTAVYSKVNESEEYKIANLDMNTECYVVSVFSDVNNEDATWSAIASLVTTDSDKNKTYQMISDVKRSDERTKNSKIDFMLRNADTITVDDQTIKADDLADNQEIRIVYARTSLLSNSKVTEQQHTSAEKSSTPKQSTPQQTAPADDGWGYIPPEMIVGNDAPPIHGLNIQFN